MRAGATPAFVNWRLSARELTDVLTLVEPKAIAADAEFAGRLDAAWPHAGARVTIAISEELVIRFFAALEADDIDTLREIYAPDAVIWHNDDLIEQPVEDNLKVLQGLHRAVSGLRYDIVRRVPAADGVLQQHVLRGRLPNGAEVELHAAMYLQVRDGRITRIEEYLDSARRSSIRAAREALSGWPATSVDA
jgi:ketosteroid isomerase-like protein